MSGNTLGTIFKVTTFGESHGEGIGAIIDGCPPGVVIMESDFNHDIDRRKTGKTKFTSQRKEADKVEILSGVFEGKTTGTPLTLYVKNTNQKSKDYGEIREKFRPGHADYTYFKKYGVRDYRGGGRSSARETVIRVAVGVLAKKILVNKFGLCVRGYVHQIGPITTEKKNEDVDWEVVESNAFFFPEKEKIESIEQYFHKLNKDGDSIGSGITLVASGVPVGLGDPVFDRIESRLGAAMLSIPACKGVEFGEGFEAIERKGSEHRDEMTSNGFETNHAGGMLGGITSGQDVVLRIAMKPTSSILVKGQTIDTHNNETEIVTKGRHDPCVGIRATPIAEAMMALVIMDHALRHRAQNIDVDSGTPIIPAEQP